MRHCFRMLATGFVSLFLTTSFAATPASTTTFTPAQKTEIQKIVHDYLVSNPEVLVEASNSLQKKQYDESITKADATIPQLAIQLFLSPTSPVVGNLNGNVTYIEFFDYQCPHCKHMLPVMQTVMQKFPNLRVVYKELPIFGKVSVFAAQAALAAQKQGKFAALHDALLKVDHPFANTDEILQIATKQGLDVKKLQADMQAKDIDQEIKANFTLANQLNITGTPAIIVGKTPAAGTKPTKTSLNAGFIPGQADAAAIEKLITAAQK